MALPPPDVPASELFLKLLERPQPGEDVDFGGEIGKLRIQVLRMEQHEQARISARRFLKEKRAMRDEDFQGLFGQEMLGDATARELLAMACFLPTPVKGTEDAPVYPRVFRTAEDVSKLTADEVTVLFGAYLLVQRRAGPYESSLTEPEVNAWVQRLVEGGSAVPLSLLASHQRDELIMLLAERASFLSNILACQPENLQSKLESAPSSWAIGTSSYSGPAADSTRSRDDVVTMEQAMEAARALTGKQ